MCVPFELHVASDLSGDSHQRESSPGAEGGGPAGCCTHSKSSVLIQLHIQHNALTILQRKAKSPITSQLFLLESNTIKRRTNGDLFKPSEICFWTELRFELNIFIKFYQNQTIGYFWIAIHICLWHFILSVLTLTIRFHLLILDDYIN